MDINNSFDRHLDPPEDDIEQKYCEYCNEPMELTNRGYMDWDCVNQFCPNKFAIECGTTVIEMANHLAEVEEKLKSTQNSLKYVRNSLAYVEGIRQERENTIETLENVISRMTPSQTNVVSSIVLRDTDYAIKRMEDAIEYCEITSSPDFQRLRMEWLEIKMILNYGK